MAYMTLSDDYINDLFQGTNFGEKTNNSVQEKRKLITKTLRNQLDGYWSGHTAYNIVVNGGLLKDAKRDAKKELTAAGLTHQNRTTVPNNCPSFLSFQPAA